ncbi:MAG: hypothetical protein B6I36_09670 [Desulfobacteraceae bacterium 4572_35.1]|nr:MAG: hypothetical protein B6I36_09670 [Desulfobacteraceae bacterium 4572_35.1]
MEESTQLDPLSTKPPRKESGFAGDVVKLASGTLFAQALGFVVMPILSRLYAPEAFGLVALFTSITTILVVIANLRYELSIMLPESDDESANLLALSLSFTVLTTLTTIVLIALGKNLIPTWLNEPAIGSYLWLVPVSVLFGGAFTALNYWNTRTKQFGRLSIARIIRSVGTSSAQLGAGLSGYATGGAMIGANVLGQMVSAAVLGGQIWRDDHRLFRQSISWKGMMAGLKRYRRFPLFTVWSGLLNSISWQLPVFLLSFYFSPNIVGYYALGNRVLRIPMNLLGGAIGQVFFQRASEAKNEGDLAIVVENTFARLVRLGLFPSLMLTFIGRDAFVIFFGNQWSEAGIYVQILGIWTFFWFISSPISVLFSVLERQDLGLYINILVFISRLLVLGIGGYLQNARLTIMLFGASGILVYGYLSVLLINHSGVSWKKIWQILLTNSIIFIPAGLLMLVAIAMSAPSWLMLLLAVIISGIYFLYVVKTDPQLHIIVNKVPVFNKVLQKIIGKIRYEKSN